MVASTLQRRSDFCSPAAAIHNLHHVTVCVDRAAIRAHRAPARARVMAAPQRVLVVDDTSVDRRLACRLLQKAGFVVESAENGGAGLELLKVAPFDMVLFDVNSARGRRGRGGAAAATTAAAAASGVRCGVCHHGC